MNLVIQGLLPLQACISMFRQQYSGLTVTTAVTGTGSCQDPGVVTYNRSPSFLYSILSFSGHIQLASLPPNQVTNTVFLFRRDVGHDPEICLPRSLPEPMFRQRSLFNPVYVCLVKLLAEMKLSISSSA